VNHTIGIVAHTARADHAHQLANDIGAKFISVDDGTLGCEGNHRKVWEWLAHTTTEWSIILEDDAIAVPGFREQAAAALQQAPAPVVSFYLGTHHLAFDDNPKRQAITQADQQGAHWITASKLHHAVAVAIRTQHLPDVLFYASQFPDNFPNDELITHWARNTGNTIAYAWPSLCDHLDEPTLFRHPDKITRPPGTRKAFNVGTRTTWTTKAVSM
jgi:GR25 family glycosyltransferase involved in LPS biosynthesis